MNRRGFIKAIAAGVATVALSTRLAQTAVDVVFPKLRDGMDITDVLQAAIDRSVVTGERVVLPQGDYFVSKTIRFPDNSISDITRSSIRARGDYKGEPMFYIERESDGVIRDCFLEGSNTHDSAVVVEGPELPDVNGVLFEGFASI